MFASIKYNEKMFIAGSAQKTNIVGWQNIIFFRPAIKLCCCSSLMSHVVLFWSNNIVAEQRHQIHWYVCCGQYTFWVFISMSRIFLNCKASVCISVVVSQSAVLKIKEPNLVNYQVFSIAERSVTFSPYPGDFSSDKTPLVQSVVSLCDKLSFIIWKATWLIVGLFVVILITVKHALVHRNLSCDWTCIPFLLIHEISFW